MRRHTDTQYQLVVSVSLKGINNIRVYEGNHNYETLEELFRVTSRPITFCDTYQGLLGDVSIYGQRKKRKKRLFSYFSLINKSRVRPRVPLNDRLYRIQEIISKFFIYETFKLIIFNEDV